MHAVARVSAAPQRQKPNGRGTAMAIGLSGAPIDIDERKVKQMLSTLLRGQRRRSGDRFPSQLEALEDLFLKLQWMALTDDLTGLYNRRGFLRAGTRLLEALRRDRIGALLFYVDVDNLKAINDSAGHAAGDSLLTRTAHVLRAAFRDRDPVARLGGDEFAVLVATSDARASKRIMARIQAATAVANLSHTEPLLSLSVGFAQFDPGKPSSLPELLRKADTVMYASKLAKLRHLTPRTIACR